VIVETEDCRTHSGEADRQPGTGEIFVEKDKTISMSRIAVISYYAGFNRLFAREGVKMPEWQSRFTSFQVV